MVLHVIHMPIVFSTAALCDELEPIVRLWVLRMLVPLAPLHADTLTPDDWCRFASALKLPEKGSQSITMNSGVPRVFAKAHAQQEQKVGHIVVSALLRDNLQRVASWISLSEADQRILEFAICLNQSPLLQRAASRLQGHSRPKTLQALAALLQLPLSEVQQALSPKGTLVRSGLIKHDYLHNDFKDWLQLLSDDFAEQMLGPPVQAHQLLRTLAVPAPAPHLALSDYAHVQSALQVLLPYLQRSVQARRAGVNVLVYGPPGTGKTQLARVLAQALQVQLLEVSCCDEDGDPITGAHRLRAYHAAQSFFANAHAMLVFDEMEDAFQDESTGRRPSTAQSRKAWMNRALEHNPLPTVWVSNSIAQVDPAYIRRFDLCLELPIPPRSQRLRMLRAHCPETVDATLLARLADVPALAPAVVERAQRVAALAAAPKDGSVPAAVSANVVAMSGCQKVEASAEMEATHGCSYSQALELLLSSTLQAQGHGPLPGGATDLPAFYDPTLLHADVDLQQLASGLRAAGSARLCLYGPPGTGKTAYGRWLAQQLDRPLLVKRASDLQSPWVGATERNIAQAFQEATSEGAVLMIDEIDSFLQSRGGVHHSWEVSQVNEMLTQMEVFDGVFMASTNCLEALDCAALRRFDLKVKLDFLRPAHAWALLLHCCSQLGWSEPDNSVQQALFGVQQLTPGDFAAVLRQHRFRPLPDAHALVQALRAECKLKDMGGSRTIGFVSHGG